jgi:exodeoxyribonuclease V alpha subunit
MGERGTRDVVIRTLENDLEFAYALTVHRYQGSECDVVLVPMHSSFSRMLLYKNLIYTALSRAKKLCVVVGEVDVLQRAVTTDVRVPRMTLLADVLTGWTP